MDSQELGPATYSKFPSLKLQGIPMPISKRAAAEFIGTFWLVFGGCGAAVLAAGFPAVGIGFAGVALAFGFTVLTMAFALGHISSCHLNPVVSVGWSSASASQLPICCPT